MSQSNPFLSMEGAELDANNNNPLLNAEDPTKAAEEASETKPDDFELILPESVEGENLKESDIIFDGEVEEKVKDAANIVKTADKTSDTLQALASISQELFGAIQTHGKLTTSEMLVTTERMNSLESLSPWVGEGEVELPSMENYQTVGMQYTGSQIALEGVMGALGRGIERLFNLIGALLKLGIGLAKSMTPFLDKKIARAQALLTSIDNSHREAGLKELRGSFTKNLAIDGRMPDAQTVVKTASYMVTCASELLSDQIYAEATKFSKIAGAEISKAYNITETPQPSGFLTLIIFVGTFGGGLFLAGPLKLLFDSIKVQKNIKVDPALVPQVFKMFPNISKLNTTPPEDGEYFDIKRSLPLFGNKALYAWQIKSTIKPLAAGHYLFPNVKLFTGDNPAPADGPIQALTTAQQKDVLTSTIAMLNVAKNYYGDYATKVNSLYKLNSSVLEETRRHQTTADNMGRGWGGSIATGTLNAMYRGYWKGLLSDQSTFARHISKTASSLIELVAASSDAAKANIKSEVAQESLSVDVNPFMK